MGSKKSGTKGKTNNPNGRPKGSQNKDVSLVREAVANLLDEYTPKMHGWLDVIARESPEKAMGIVKDLLEYSIPKLQRTELQALDKDGNKADNVSKIVIEHVGVKK